MCHNETQSEKMCIQYINELSISHIVLDIPLAGYFSRSTNCFLLICLISGTTVWQEVNI